MFLKKIRLDEKLDKWEKLPVHTNVANVFHTFVHRDGDKTYLFSLSETTKTGNMFNFINDLNLNLGITIPASYMEIIYDCMIQITMGMEHAHNHGLIHGTFGLHNIIVAKEGDTNIFKISNFTPGSCIDLPLSEKANFWPFIKGKQKQSEAEKLEILMLKDIYSIGICLLELMIGRYNNKKYSISLDSLPLTWAEYAESTPLI
jgi:serine/threonine protein kinase